MNITLTRSIKVDQAKSIVVLNQPDKAHDLDGVIYTTKLTKNHDRIISFVFNYEDLVKIILEVDKKDYLEEKGMLVVAYPKKTNKVFDTYLERDICMEKMTITGQNYVLETKLKFNGLLAYNDEFSAWTFLKRTPKNNENLGTPKEREWIGVEELLKIIDNNIILEKFNQLSLGYQRQWTNYVMSAKTAPTREKRLLEMYDLIMSGVKSPKAK